MILGSSGILYICSFTKGELLHIKVHYAAEAECIGKGFACPSLQISPTAKESSFSVNVKATALGTKILRKRYPYPNRNA